MKFDELVSFTSKQPVFETGLLLAGTVDPGDVRRQLSRWTQAGKVIQLRRGVYTLAAPYQHVPPHPFVIANTLLPGSYVSLHSALAHYGLIPEFVSQTLSVSTLRPSQWHNPLGDFRFQHVAAHLFFGYQKVSLTVGQEAFVALPEKALLDLIHLTPNGEDPLFLAGLRLQNLESLDRERLKSLAERAGKPKWLRAVSRLFLLIDEEAAAYTSS
jgi:predicted transcriptional regulator of viral defense system